MATGAADGFLRSLIYEGCISGCDLGIERRPYHRNCRCALHDKSFPGNCSHVFPKSKKVSYPIRRSWSEGSLAMAAVAASVHSSPSSPSSAGVGNRRLGSYKEEEEDD
ncbi:hypothetical protein HRI_004394000 [Hibiscus trionum]|uniref:Uncharacterized protein n=1 Tax=Hibiscus trionum TaxID=183268 RepID=A0A9W7J338_HIBTR|nr:hypothetical protein HRI_004394000 [Hibiscus trionum]